MPPHEMHKARLSENCARRTVNNWDVAKFDPEQNFSSASTSIRAAKTAVNRRPRSFSDGRLSCHGRRRSQRHSDRVRTVTATIDTATFGHTLKTDLFSRASICREDCHTPGSGTPNIDHVHAIGPTASTQPAGVIANIQRPSWNVDVVFDLTVTLPAHRRAWDNSAAVPCVKRYADASVVCMIVIATTTLPRPRSGHMRGLPQSDLWAGGPIIRPKQRLPWSARGHQLRRPPAQRTARQDRVAVTGPDAADVWCRLLRDATHPSFRVLQQVLKSPGDLSIIGRRNGETKHRDRLVSALTGEGGAC
jgi:hypothetical protein